MLAPLQLGLKDNAARRLQSIFPCRHYHASLSPDEREAVQAEWTSGEVPIIVATIAFGMGEQGRRGTRLRRGRGRASCCALLTNQ